MTRKFISDLELIENRMLITLLDCRCWNLIGMKVTEFISITRDNKNRGFVFEYK